MLLKTQYLIRSSKKNKRKPGVIFRLLFFVIFFSLLLLNFSSCKFNFFNEKQISVEAQETTIILHQCIDRQDFSKADTLFSKTFFQNVKWDSMLKMFSKTKTILGAYQSNMLVEWKTHRSTGKGASTECQLIYELTYEKYKARESITLKKEDKGFKIIGYEIFSEGFLDEELLESSFLK